MTKLHKVEVFTSMSSDGVSTVPVFGTPVTVDGTPMVRLSHGSIVSADGWSADEATAKAKAAEKIEEFGRRILAQAERMRGATS